ncbi:VOC family protein [Nocardia terpenica]|uniref:Glyoxalase n=1 Tax=Nocardia terpenica TaxID=455432 RepID=A0A164JWQ3_9NOCA|nr:VOC family protein [Nocardia terpenica]KZM70796.1 glyoxalase [Nocardia terpenica]MBF6060177.1 VOC family protein [Nocardia terpenica]MBF6103437.1 VOC family protein [Nocardia terpenica]MBF6112189.1 VOC family protein [Nocardia terpenica]MBF6117658.1 VOC family protein [Nocardia terpenica]
MDILASRIIVRPANYERTVAFYRDGLGLAIAREYPGGTVFFAGQSLVEVAGHGRREDAPTDFAGALWLQVRSASDAAAELALRGVAIDRPPVRERWGLIEMWVRDPDGVPIVLVEVPAEHPMRRDTRNLD